MRYEFGGLTFGGACTRRGLFSEFYGMIRECFKCFYGLDDLKSSKDEVMSSNTYKRHQPILPNNKLLRAGILKIKTTFEGKLQSGDAQTKERILDAPCGGKFHY